MTFAIGVFRFEPKKNTRAVTRTRKRQLYIYFNAIRTPSILFRLLHLTWSTAEAVLRAIIQALGVACVDGGADIKNERRLR